MIKRRSDEPDDKALERLRQFEEQRKPVPDMNRDDEQKDDKKKKPGKKVKGKKKEKDTRDKATDQL